MNIEEIKARNKLAFEGDHDDLEQLIGIHKSTYENLCASQNDVNALIAEMERLTDMYSTSEEISEKLICRAEKAESKNATLKKALELACEALSNTDLFNCPGVIRTCRPKSTNEYMDDYIQQAQKQLTHETQEAEK